MAVPSRHAGLSEELAELIASGVDMYVATRNAELLPESMLALAGKIHGDGCAMTVFLPEVTSAATLANLRENGQIAITISRPRDHKTVQVKGKATRIRPSDESEKDLQAVLRASLVEGFAHIGIPRSTSRRLVWWPSVAVDVQVNDVFQQTPGPHAGEPLSRV